MARWSQEGIPHKGWRYVDVEDVFTMDGAISIALFRISAITPVPTTGTQANTWR